MELGVLDEKELEVVVDKKAEELATCSAGVITRRLADKTMNKTSSGATKPGSSKRTYPQQGCDVQLLLGGRHCFLLELRFLDFLVRLVLGAEVGLATVGEPMIEVLGSPVPVLVGRLATGDRVRLWRVLAGKWVSEATGMNAVKFETVVTYRSSGSQSWHTTCVFPSSPNAFCPVAAFVTHLNAPNL